MSARLIAAMAVLSLSTGCLTSRSILSVSEAGTRNLTLVQTNDTYTILPGYGYDKHQFWTCKEDGDVLACKKACDTKNSQLACMAAASTAASSNQAANSSSK